MSHADDFERRLKLYDPKLRLRWAGKLGWALEREGRVSEGELRFLKFAASKATSPDDIEKYKSAQNGAFLIAFARVLDNKIFDDLALHDLQRKGNGPVAQVAKKLAEREKLKADSRKASHETARQTNDVLHHMLKKRSSEIHAGKSDLLIAEGFGMKVKTGQVFGPPQQRKTSTGILDSFGRPLHPLDARN